MFEDEHHGRSEPETQSEFVLRLHWVGLGIIAALGAGGNAEWSRDTLVAMGLVGPILLLANHFTPEGGGRPLLRRFLVWMFPCWVTLGIFAIALWHPPYELVEEGPRQYWSLLGEAGPAMPVSGHHLAVFLEVFLLIGVYAATVNAVIIPEGRLVFARTWAVLVLYAGALALVGLLQRGMGARDMLWLFPLQNPNFYATFTHNAQWCAFALLWMGAALGLLAWLVRQRGWAWLSGDGWLLLAVAILLGTTIVRVGDPLHQVAGAAVAGIGCILIAWQTWADRKKGTMPKVVALLWLLVGLGIWFWGAEVATTQDASTWVKYDGDRPGEPLHLRVIEDTQTMWRERPWFGWGHNSFGIAFSFYQQTDESPYYFAFARSDLWQSLAENGIIGTFIWWLPVLWIGLRILWKRRLASFLIAPLAALAAVAGMGVVDFPFNSPAVFYGWWLLFFTLGRWTFVDDETFKSVPERRRIRELRSRGETTAPHPAAAPATPPAAH